VSGVCRTVRGPSMSAGPGKVQILGTEKVMGQKVFVLRFLQGRDPDWVHRPFFAKYNAKASWLDDLEPAFGEESFFYEQEPAHSLHK
ncbi:MAG: lysine 2,3-aminomutase, partial [Bacteroidota bacterium]